MSTVRDRSAKAWRRLAGYARVLARRIRRSDLGRFLRQTVPLEDPNVRLLEDDKWEL